MSATIQSPELARAVEELEHEFPNRVVVDAQDPSGVVIRIRELPLGPRWTPQTGDLWFTLPFHYPDAPVYPYYVTGAVLGGGAVSGFQAVSWRDMSVIQVSLRHNHWDPARDTIVGCVLQTQSWLLRT